MLNQNSGGPSESGVPDNRIASCPNFPECECMHDCSGDMTRDRLRLPEWILLGALGAGTLLGACLVLAQGGGNG
ncbi:hypothetical protein [Nitratireductor luteus]|uniref:hypothetical protein n=1 Tax=Nitratireductor luteus TaxID=2976980 RepID=UPI00223F0663|nr:hypothetical protein [Nitratireductor luteus]